ncbi:hypothetical protein B0T24DRAFT_593834 [Lasiosphaeria ovina]|uniref:Uncharacterized protein n=1 Tax=Lasiosphaeria ovina TaxID=92902 RepID=A0AAE0KBY0_9PEZI|nr:hypothetical protein B0T24DRAFT_593834 [Lasiosphaeria ovina]
MPGAGECLVDMMAAKMDIPDEVVKPVDGDHVGMCQFDSADNMTFQELCDQISEVYRRVYETARQRPLNETGPGTIHCTGLDRDGRTVWVDARVTVEDRATPIVEEVDDEDSVPTPARELKALEGPKAEDVDSDLPDMDFLQKRREVKRDSRTRRRPQAEEAFLYL